MQLSQAQHITTLDCQLLGSKRKGIKEKMKKIKEKNNKGEKKNKGKKKIKK